MLRGNLMESPVNAALQLAPKAFNGIGVNLSANKFVLTMSNTLVLVAMGAKQVIGGVFIGADQRTGLNHCNGVGSGRGTVNYRGNVGPDFTVTLNNAHHDGLTMSALSRDTGALVHVHVAPLAADIGLIRFDHAREKVAALIHQLANLMPHAPCGLVGYAKLTLQFLRANPVLAGRHQEHGEEPSAKLCAAFVEDRALAGVNLMTAIGARVATARLNAMEGVSAPASRAETTVRMALVEDVIQARRIIGKLAGELVERVTFCFHADRIPASSHA